jgi:hypothetical protein
MISAVAKPFGHYLEEPHDVIIVDVSILQKLS